MNGLSNKVFDIISNNWPTHATEIAESLGYDVSTKEAQKKSVAKIKYHIDQLARDQKVRVKKIGQALVCWPSEIEKLRMVHELVKGI